MERCKDVPEPKAKDRVRRRLDGKETAATREQANADLQDIIEPNSIIDVSQH